MKDWSENHPLGFQIIQVMYSVYLMLLAYLIANYSYLLLLGIFSFILVVGIRKFKMIKIINFYFCFTLLLAYIIYLFDFLILKGYISEVNNPFFLMGLTLHFPVISFNVFAIFSLRGSRLINNNNNNKITRRFS